MKITNVKQLVWELGGSLVVAYHLNVHQITIARWIKKNGIPEKYRPPLLELSKERGLQAREVEKLILVAQ